CNRPSPPFDAGDACSRPYSPGCDGGRLALASSDIMAWYSDTVCCAVSGRDWPFSRRAVANPDTKMAATILRSFIGFAPGLVGTYQDSGDGGGRHCPPPSMNGNQSWLSSRCRQRHLARSERRRIERDLATSCFVGEPLALRA